MADNKDPKAYSAPHEQAIIFGTALIRRGPVGPPRVAESMAKDSTRPLTMPSSWAAADTDGGAYNGRKSMAWTNIAVSRKDGSRRPTRDAIHHSSPSITCSTKAPPLYDIGEDVETLSQN